MWDFLLDVVFPRQCYGCGKWGNYLCQKCRQTQIEYFDNQVCSYCELPSPNGLTHPRCFKENGLDGMFVLAHYRGLIPKLLHEIKYQGYFAVVDELTKLIVSKYHYQYDFQYFVPVPLSKRRQNDRGFNQAEKLATHLAKSLPDYRTTRLPKNIGRQVDGRPVVKLLIRVRDTKPQFDLKMDQRKTNVKDAFSISYKLQVTSLKGISFCLVDDVATTGATIFECAKVLKKAGAQKVWAICVARGG